MTNVLFGNSLDYLPSFQVDLSIRTKEDGGDSNFSKYSAIGNRKAVPNRLPNLDKGYILPKTEPKTEPKHNVPKNEPTIKVSDNKKNTGDQGTSVKQISNATTKSMENKAANKEISKGKQNSETKKGTAKGNMLQIVHD